jgi:hypothetical protein
MARKSEAAQHRSAKYPSVALVSQLREQQREKRVAAATASLQTVTNNFDHYLKTMMVAVPLAAILLHAVTVKDQTTVKFFDLTFKLQSAALVVTALGCVFLLYCARCLGGCVNAIEQSRSQNDLRNYLQNHPGIMNPFYRRIDLKYPGLKEDFIDFSVSLHRWANKPVPEELRADLQKGFSDGIPDPAVTNFAQKARSILGWICRAYGFVSATMGLILAAFVWIFLVGSANRIVDPTYNSLYTSQWSDLLRIINAPLYSLIVILFAFCFCIYLVALARSLKVVCPKDYVVRMLTFFASLLGFSFLSGLVFLLS